MARTLGPAGPLAPTGTRPSVGRIRRTLGGLLAVVALTGISAVAGPVPAAHAALGDLVCATNFQINFTPPLTLFNTTADADADSALVDCESPNGAYPDLASATVTGSGEATSLGGVPCSLLLTIEGTGRIEWNTGQVSRFDVLINTNPLQGIIIVTAEVTSGPLAGDSITPVFVEANPNPDCALVGLTNLTSVLTLVSFG